MWPLCITLVRCGAVRPRDDDDGSGCGCRACLLGAMWGDSMYAGSKTYAARLSLKEPGETSACHGGMGPSRSLGGTAAFVIVCLCCPCLPYRAVRARSALESVFCTCVATCKGSQGAAACCARCLPPLQRLCAFPFFSCNPACRASGGGGAGASCGVPGRPHAQRGRAMMMWAAHARMLLLFLISPVQAGGSHFSTA